MNRPPDILKAWRAELLLCRTYTSPNAKPLYSYQVTADEFVRLCDLLRTHRDHASHYMYGDSWASAFCMFVAESYRREYDGGEDGWSWHRFERALDCDFSPQKRADLVERGLAYWRRPIRQRDGRRDLLGSLCVEGGLPWPLVQSDTHGFGRAVRRGLKYFYRTEGGRRTTADLIAEAEDDLPITFRNLDTRQLLAGIVEQLMYLVRQYPLKDQPDPAAYLDHHAKDWRADFPIPLDETNARSLVNDWLHDAGKRDQERKEVLARERQYGCEHLLIGDATSWIIKTELTMPSEESFTVDGRALGSTRLTLAFYEGEKLIAHAGAVYGQLQDGHLRVRYPAHTFCVERKDLTAPVSLRLLASGRPIHVIPFEGSDLDLEELPLVFERRDDQWWLAATASCRLVAQTVRIRLPLHAQISSGVAQELGTEHVGACWVQTSQDLTLRKGSEVYQIELNRDAADIGRPFVNGRLALYNSKPGTVFIGWPRLEVPGESPYTATELEIFDGGRRTQTNKRRAGVIRYTVRTRCGKTVLQRLFGILPEDFGLQLLPALGNLRARIVLKNARGLLCQVIGEKLSAQQEGTDQGIVLHLTCQNPEPPSHFILELSTPGEAEPVVLRLTYPRVGARLIDSDDRLCRSGELTVDELMGTRVVLSSTAVAGQSFYLQFELVSRENSRLRRHYIVRVTDTPVLVGLFTYTNDIQQMLGAVDEQDAYVKMSVETDHVLLRINIRRYNGMLRKEELGRFVVQDMDGNLARETAMVEAMVLSDPKRAPLCLAEYKTQGVGTSTFAISPEIRHNGPWLIYPSKASNVRFRPELFEHASSVHELCREPESLHEAARAFHPKINPGVIDRQIQAMAADLDHSGWQYLDDLRRKFDHLPLSTFQSWLSLSKHADALATAVFRLEVDESFCGRVYDELAVFWECIPLDAWMRTFERFRLWLSAQGLPEIRVASVLENRSMVLKTVVPGFDQINDYLSTEDPRTLKKPPIAHVLPPCYQELRRNHEADSRWPTDLGPALAEWVNRTALPPEIRKLSNVEYTHAVTYLPIFMAYVTVGKTAIAALPGPESYVKFAIRALSDFDRRGWYLYIHSVLVSYLLASKNG